MFNSLSILKSIKSGHVQLYKICDTFQEDGFCPVITTLLFFFLSYDYHASSSINVMRGVRTAREARNDFYEFTIKKTEGKEKF